MKQGLRPLRSFLTPDLVSRALWHLCLFSRRSLLESLRMGMGLGDLESVSNAPGLALTSVRLHSLL